MKPLIAFALLGFVVTGCVASGQHGIVCPARGGAPWLELTTDHFVVETDLPPNRARAVASQLENLSIALALDMFTQTVKIQGRLEVVVFATKDEFLEYAPLRSSAGFFTYDSLGRQRMVLGGDWGPAQLRIVAHELAHYFAAHVYARQPRWFSEGVARDVERFAGPNVSLWSAQRYVPSSSIVPSREVLEWRKAGEDDGPRYETSWLLVRLLTEQRRDQFLALQRRFAAGEDPLAAWNAVFPEWSTKRPGAISDLDWLLWRFGYDARPQNRSTPNTHVSVVERRLTPSEVHTVSLSLLRSRPRTLDSLRAEVDEALSEDPGNVVALSSSAAMGAGDQVKAARKAVELRPRDMAAWLILGRSLTDEGETKEREAALRKAVELAPDRAQPWIFLSFELLAQDRPAEALTAADRATSLAPWSAFALGARAVALANLDRCDDALLTGQRAVEVVSEELSPGERELALQDAADLQRRCGSQDARRAEELFRKAARLRRAGDMERASTLLEKTVALDPRHRFARVELADSYRTLGRYEEAVRALRAQLDLDPNHPTAWADLGESQWRLKRLGEAAGALRHQLQLTPEDAIVHFRLARVLAEDGHGAEARAELEAGEKLQAAEPWALVRRGQAQLAVGEVKQGVQSLGEVVQIALDPSIWNAAAYALAEAGVALELAETWAQKAIAARTAQLPLTGEPITQRAVEVTQSLATEWDTLGWIRFGQGRIEEAAAFVIPSERLRSSAEVSEHLGRILERLGRRDEALEAYARAASSSEAAFPRRRLAELLGEPRAAELAKRARDERRRRSVLHVAGAATKVQERSACYVLFRRDGAIEAPGSGLRPEVHHGIAFPDPSADRLALRAWSTCRANGCELDLVDAAP